MRENALPPAKLILLVCCKGRAMPVRAVMERYRRVAETTAYAHGMLDRLVRDGLVQRIRGDKVRVTPLGTQAIHAAADAYDWLARLARGNEVA